MFNIKGAKLRSVLAKTSCILIKLPKYNVYVVTQFNTYLINKVLLFSTKAIQLQFNIYAAVYI